jgi:hypothetical protein
MAENAPNVARFRKYAIANLKTRIEMWRRTGNPGWLTEDWAHKEALGLLGHAVSQASDDEAMRTGLDFLTIRTTALKGPARVLASGCRQ